MDFVGGATSRASSPPDWLRRIHPAAWLLALFLLFLPAFANDFIQLQVFGWAFVLGMIALSLMFLAGYGGMVSLVQMTVAGCAGYMYAIFGHSAFMEISLGWPWWATIPVALIIAVIFGTISGAAADPAERAVRWQGSPSRSPSWTPRILSVASGGVGVDTRADEGRPRW